MRNFASLAGIIRDLYVGATPEISEVRKVLAVERVFQGASIETASRDFRLQPHRLRALAESVQRQGVGAFVDTEAIPADAFARAKNGIAQMLLSALHRNL